MNTLIQLKNIILENLYLIIDLQKMYNAFYK